MHILDQVVSQNHLLKHPFYQRWMNGTLTQGELKSYVQNYYPHVLAFPQYVSATHANCDDAATRKALLENLIEEEHGENNHPELWLRFGESLGLSRDEITGYEPIEEAKELVTTFKSLSQKNYASGIGALYAYESQVPQVAEQKIDGLKRLYDVTDEKGLEFFNVHLKADEYHAQSEKDAYEKLDTKDQVQALEAASVATKALWNFLSGLDRNFLPVDKAYGEKA